MGTTAPLVTGLVVLVLAAASWAVVAAATHPVGFARVEAFASRQGLDVSTVRGSADVLRYLAVTRRWRVGGLAVAEVFAFGGGVRAGRINIDLGAAFLGWFAGALIAEWRLNVRPAGVRRTALLTRRRLRDYLGVPGLASPAACLALLLMMGVFGLQRAGALPTAVALVGGLVPAVAAAVTARNVMLRPSLDAAPNIDHALRSRSLHVLSGAVTASAIAGVAGLILVSSQLNPSSSRLLGLAVLVAGMVAGWLIANVRGPRHDH